MCFYYSFHIKTSFRFSEQFFFRKRLLHAAPPYPEKETRFTDLRTQQSTARPSHSQTASLIVDLVLSISCSPANIRSIFFLQYSWGSVI